MRRLAIVSGELNEDKDQEWGTERRAIKRKTRSHVCMRLACMTMLRSASRVARDNEIYALDVISLQDAIFQIIINRRYTF